MSAYWYPFRIPVDSAHRKSELFPGTTLTRVWNHYRFDRRLCLLLLDAIERIEVALRAAIAYRFAEFSGPFGYETLLPANVIEKIKINASLKKQYDFVTHFAGKYSGDYLPVWMAVGVMDFGDLSSFLNSLGNDIQKKLPMILAFIQNCYARGSEHFVLSGMLARIMHVYGTKCGEFLPRSTRHGVGISMIKNRRNGYAIKMQACHFKPEKQVISCLSAVFF